MLFYIYLGNDAIHQLTKNRPVKLRVDLQRFSGEKGYGEYSTFAVGDENSNYKMNVTGFHGTIGEVFFSVISYNAFMLI